MNHTEPGIHESDHDFDIRLDRFGDVVVLSLTGRLEEVACLILQQYLVNVLVARTSPLLVVDLHCLTAADAHGRDILVSAARHAKASEGRMIVVGGGVLPRHENAVLDQSPSLEEALAELTARRP
ncbi:STAS domain-containing protein [Nonomuraea sp. 10N515B]|uniref:STAS domain-containing protein n=1 Tax=Nonomuraea sp. 10N515B TaxID=3457422 RepID=UPI003FCE29EF